MPRKSSTAKTSKVSNLENVKLARAKLVKGKLPRAVPMGFSDGFESAYCLKSGKKYIATQWWTLEKGKQFTAPKGVIASLRNAGFVR